MTEAWYNAVFEKDKSSNMSIPIHFYLYNLSYCYGIKSNDHMNLNWFKNSSEKKINLHIKGKILNKADALSWF